MNYYIDFDSTMFNTEKFKKRLAKTIIEQIRKQKLNLQEQELAQEYKETFNRENIYDIYKLITYFSDKYNLKEDPIKYNLNEMLLNNEDLVFSDVIPFLQKLKIANHKLYILSASAGNLSFQNIKIFGSGLMQYFDSIITTAIPKYELDINYNNGIFIDDNPKDLLGLYSKNPKQVIRIKRKECSYSVAEIKNTNIEEYINFDDIKIV